ncbi:MAG: 3-dehydroquinate synthase [Saprospiraceae bacterium]|nr:3-dehydroquinate synthase [Saprospiraceae bacterium]
MQLGLQNYQIHFGKASSSLKEFMEASSFSKVAVLVDPNTREHCLSKIEEALPKGTAVLEIPDGELEKTLETCKKIWAFLLEEKFDRKGLLINLGGGVIGDMGGFCAATYKRGISFLQVPTTLLSQVDASVGGKLGVDFLGVKNIVGVFRDPETVIIDPDFLSTLTKRELISGFAEVIKHALIASPDQCKDFFEKGDLEDIHWEKTIIESVSIKRDIVEKDLYEQADRKKLNFGHTVGHAIETQLLNSSEPLLHGEAVAWGMMVESVLSQKTGLEKKDLEIIMAYLKRTFSPKPLDLNLDDLIKIMENDKKNEGGQINFTMLSKPGISLINQTASQDEIRKAILRVNSFLAS